MYMILLLKYSHTAHSHSIAAAGTGGCSAWMAFALGRGKIA